MSDEEVYESSGEEWSEAAEKKRNPSRKSQRLSKKPRTQVESSDSEIEKKVSRRKTPGKSKLAKKSYVRGTFITAANFESGGFIVQKKDLQVGDSKPPCLWRIDGKALLQKFEAVTEGDKVFHKSTSIYTGWTPLDKDLYIPVKVRIENYSSAQIKVELDMEYLKSTSLESE